MKIVIEHSQTKRLIDGTFGICASREDLESLARQIKARLADEQWVYGWMSVHPEPKPIANTYPKAWDA